MSAGEKLLRSLVAMAAADGRIGKRELRLIEGYRDKWGVAEEALDRCIAEVEAGNTKVTLPQDPKSRKVFLKALVKVAAVDGVIEPGERAMLSSVAAKMDLPLAELEVLIDRALAKHGSDARTRVASDPKLEAAPEPGPPEPPRPEDLFIHIAELQAQGKPVPRELLELAALMHHALQAGQPAQRPPLMSQTPAWLQKLSTKQRVGIVAAVVALWLIVPVITGVVAGNTLVSKAEDEAAFTAIPTGRQVEAGRRTYQDATQQELARQKILDGELQKLEREAAEAKEAPERLRRFGEVRDKRWETFRREFPRGPKRSGGGR